MHMHMNHSALSVQRRICVELQCLIGLPLLVGL
jgi:hypothetical protein